MSMKSWKNGFDTVYVSVRISGSLMDIYWRLHGALINIKILISWKMFELVVFEKQWASFSTITHTWL